MTETTRAEILRQTLNIAKLARNIERAGDEAPRHRLDATVQASQRYEEAVQAFRYFIIRNTNFAL